MLVLAASCDDEPFGAGGGTGGPLPKHPTICDVDVHVFSRCTTCHNGTQFPDLRPGASAEIIDAGSRSYAGRILVVPGSPPDSLVYRKVSGPPPGEGGSMPPGGKLAPTLVTFVQTWISEGAVTDCSRDAGP